MFFRCSVPKLTVAMVPALLSDSQENNWRIVREGSRALCDETHPADSKFLWPHSGLRTMRDKGKLAATSHEWEPF